MDIKAFLFDLDGVLVDTARYHYLAWKALADRLQIPFTVQDNERLKGVSRRASLEILLSLGREFYSEEDRLQFMVDKNKLYLSYIARLTQEDLLPGALSFLHTCRQYGLGIGLGSASKNAPLILERLGISELFDVIIDGRDTQRTKPDPEVFLLGSQALGTHPEFCAVFEDSVAGIEAAKRAGMLPIGITSTGLEGAVIQYPGLKNCDLTTLLVEIAAL
ncbi:MAG: beta-phosphoglucomutase [Eubacteriales bacterium]|nr:beta-phosphoglucomutase [Eubacteriales bacterium]